MATWIVDGMAGIGSAPAATFNLNDEVQKPAQTSNVEGWKSNDPRNGPRPERRPAAVTEEPEPSPRKPEAPPTQATIGTTEAGWGSLVGPARSAADAIIAGQDGPGALNDL